MFSDLLKVLEPEGQGWYWTEPGKELMLSPLSQDDDIPPKSTQLLMA
jgi:hypothetical protein